MPGMLTEAQNTPPSSGPVSQTPPAGDPGAGTPLPGDSAAGSGQPPGPQDVGAMRDEAIQLVYGERFESLIKMFETNGAEKFPRSMGIAINTAIAELEKTHGEIPPETAAEIGMDLMMKLIEDIVGEKILPDVTIDQIREVLPATLVMYGDSHPNVSKEDLQAVMSEVQSGLAAQQGGAVPDPNQAPVGNQSVPAPPLSTGPGPEPSGSPVPPGAI